MDAAKGYKSNSQIARRITEAWVPSNLPCPKCGGKLEPYADNMRTKDFFCSKCREDYQLKSKTGKFGGRLLGAAYGPTVEAARKGEFPSLLLLSWRKESNAVTGLRVIAGAAISPAAIIPRKPLGPNARRAGWQGCIINLRGIPQSAIVIVVQGGRLTEGSNYLDSLSPLRELRSSQRHWLTDVLNVVDRLGTEFLLGDVYAAEDELAKSHPENSNVRPKIRQQLQVLRDLGLLVFEGRGRYRRLVRTG